MLMVRDMENGYIGTRMVTKDQNLPISSIRIKKFCADTQFDTSVEETGYKPKVSLLDAISETLLLEFRRDDDI